MKWSSFFFWKQSANPSKNDWYWVFNMALTRRLGTGDYDGDGIPDNIDRCPKIPGRGSTKGCPDADGDGVADREDECPHKYGPLSMGGCPLKGVDYDSIADVEGDVARVLADGTVETLAVAGADLTGLQSVAWRGDGSALVVRVRIR